MALTVTLVSAEEEVWHGEASLVVARSLEQVQRREQVDVQAPVQVPQLDGGRARDLLQPGGLIRLRKLHPEYDPTDRLGAINYLHQRHAAGEVVTGLLYAHPDAADLHDMQNTVTTPLNALSDAELVPGAAALAAFNAALR